MNKLINYPLLSLLTMFYTSVAFSASDIKTIPGAMCQPQYSQNSVLRSSTGAMYNDSTSYQNWTCPLVRDTIASGTNSLRYELKVLAFDNSFNGMVHCTAYSRNALGEAHDSSRTKVNTTGSYRQWKLTLTDLRLDSAVAGYYYARCMVPGKRWINGRWVRAGIVSQFYQEIW